MEGNFEVYQDGKSVGTVALTREGLYYHIRCRCKLDAEAVTRLMWKQGHDYVSLGILVPMAGGFGLDTRIAVKKCPGEKPEFVLVEKGKEDLLKQAKEILQPEEREDTIPQERNHQPEFVPIREDEPFPALEKLENAVLACQEEQLGALIREPEEPCPTD